MAAFLITLFILFCSLRGNTAQESLFNSMKDSDEYGLRFACNDYLAIQIINERSTIYLTISLDEVPVCNTRIVFNDPKTSKKDIYVINVAVGRKQTEERLHFVLLMTNTSAEYPSLIIGTVAIGVAEQFKSESSSLEIQGCYNLDLNGKLAVRDLWIQPPLISNMQVDPNGEYAYIFLRDAIFIYDIEKNNVESFFTNDVIPPYWYNIHAVDIGETDDRTRIAIVAGYAQGQYDIDKSLLTIYLMRLNPPSNLSVINSISLNDIYVPDIVAFLSYLEYGMTVTIHDRTKKVLVSAMFFNRVYLLSFTNTSIVLIRSFNYTARSVAWLDDEGMLAAFLIYDLPIPPWAKSRVQVVNTSTDDGQVMYVYPNNQQMLLTGGEEPTFMRMSTSRNHQVILQTGNGFMALVPKSPPGYFSVLQPINFNGIMFSKCPPGTYKDRLEAAPCEVCPPGTASAIQSELNEGGVTKCTDCSKDSFCPMASVRNINLSAYPSQSIFPVYPETQSLDSFDDILINSAFSIDGRSTHCIVTSPLFWTFVVMAFCFIIILIMGVLYYTPKTRTHFDRLRYIFRQADLIGAGEFWVGGLISFSLLVLIIYGFWFGTAFVKLYPAESSADANFVCDASLRNVKFTSSMYLLGSHYGEQDTNIFDMFDEQDLMLTIDFIQTGFSCKDVFIKEIDGDFAIEIQPNECFIQPDNATLTVSLPVSSLHIGFEFYLLGNAYVGGIRLCLNSSEKLNPDNLNTIQQLKLCKLIFNQNETLAKSAIVHVEMTKIINKTESLVKDDPAMFSGIWLPQVIPEHINDALVYNRSGFYSRYLHAYQMVRIDFKETPFFIMNIQEPIARSGEIIFKNILFSTMCLELFGFAFLLFKLAIFPLLRRFVAMIRKRRNRQSKLIQDTNSVNVDKEVF